MRMIWYKIITHVKKWYQIITLVQNWYQIITDVKNWYLIITDVSDKIMINLYDFFFKYEIRCYSNSLSSILLFIRNEF